MQYYLKHYFNPDFDHQRAKPGGGLGIDENADVYSLGYVQNVIAGQVLAEMIPLDQAPPDKDPRFIRDTNEFPAGPNTKIDPAYPNFLLADTKGYVFYNAGKITVKSLLNVRQDVSFHTGNIFFVGDMCAHGSVRSGFSVQANNLRVKGMVEGGIVRARCDLQIDGGVRGGSSQHCLLVAGGKLLTPFLEKAEVRVSGNMAIEKYCLYSTVYAGANIIVKGQVYGSAVNALGTVYVGAQLGNRAAIPTQVFLGYDPLKIRRLENLDARIANLLQTIMHLKAVAGHLPPDTNETTRKLAAMVEQHAKIKERRNKLASLLEVDDQSLGACRLMVPGRVYPGVEISIGRAYMLTERVYENAVFRLCYNDIVVEPMPERKKG